MDQVSTFLMVVLVMIGIVVLVMVMKTLYTVRTSTAGVVERFGKFNRIVQAGAAGAGAVCGVRVLCRPAGEAGAVPGGDEDARQRVCADPGERAVPDSAGQDL